MTPSGIFAFGGGILLIGALLGTVVIMQDNATLLGRVFTGEETSNAPEVEPDEVVTENVTAQSDAEALIAQACGRQQEGCYVQCGNFSFHYQQTECRPGCQEAYTTCLKVTTLSMVVAEQEPPLTGADLIISPAP